MPKIESKLHLGYGHPLPSVVLSKSTFSQSAWAHLCHKFGIEQDPEKVIKLKVQSGEYPGEDSLHVTCVWQ
jgi:hypothetical protein